MTIEEVKEHFKDAKTVKCLYDNKGYKVENLVSLSKKEFCNYWCRDDYKNNRVKLYDENKNELAEIIQYKEHKQIKPTHYQTNSIDVIDFCSAYGLNFNRGSATKYIARAGSKTYDGLNTKDSELKDLEKAIDFLQREIQTIKNK